MCSHPRNKGRLFTMPRALPASPAVPRPRPKPDHRTRPAVPIRTSAVVLGAAPSPGTCAARHRAQGQPCSGWSPKTPTLHGGSLAYFWGVVTSQGVRRNPFPPVVLRRSPGLLWRAHLVVPKATLAPGGLQDGGAWSTLMVPSHPHSADHLRTDARLTLAPHPLPPCAYRGCLLPPASARDPGKS